MLINNLLLTYHNFTLISQKKSGKKTKTIKNFIMFINKNVIHR